MAFSLSPLHGSSLSGGYKIPKGATLGDIAKRGPALHKATGKQYFLLRGGMAKRPKKGSFADQVLSSLNKNGTALKLSDKFVETVLGKGANGKAVHVSKR
jgi:hypothetical protein